ncbi:MAG: hypothetical protein D3906_18240 [Candidatus Electrothrix sp. AUS1_2]|nr:hypothetical protein [Candidatus Electrothrix sp. AUS1_2]
MSSDEFRRLTAPGQVENVYCEAMVRNRKKISAPFERAEIFVRVRSGISFPSLGTGMTCYFL